MAKLVVIYLLIGVFSAEVCYVSMIHEGGKKRWSPANSRCTTNLKLPGINVNNPITAISHDEQIREDPDVEITLETIVTTQYQAGYVDIQPEPLGLAEGSVKDDQISASSSWSSRKPWYGRLHGTNFWAFAARNLQDNWFQVDFLTPKVIVGIKIQGSGTLEQWVKTLEIMTGNDVTMLTPIMEYPGIAMLFNANKNKNEVADIKFPKSVVARYLRVIPISWNDWIAMRLEVIGYNCSCLLECSDNICGNDIDECSSDPCQNGGLCTDNINGYTCDCLDGYEGVNCETDIDECSSDPCQNGGLCTDIINGYTCDCLGGYEGVTCETDIDECSPDPCLNGGPCTENINSYTCNCLDGYEGVNCETDIDECSPDPCQNGGLCTDIINGYTCDCLGGYEGATCETECLSALGMENMAIPDTGITASSIEKPNRHQTNGRLNSADTWANIATDTAPWIQIDLGSLKRVSGIVTQGYKWPFQRYYVHKLNIQTGDSQSSLSYVEGSSGNAMEFTANTYAEYDAVTVLLPSILTIRIIRVEPTECMKNNQLYLACVLRLEILGCEP